MSECTASAEHGHEFMGAKKGERLRILLALPHLEHALRSHDVECNFCAFWTPICLQFVFHREHHVILTVMVANEDFPSLLEKGMQLAKTI